MIVVNYEVNFKLNNTKRIINWIKNCIKKEGFEAGEINYIFCDDEYLHKINVAFLNHDTLTDIISFDYTKDKLIQGDIFISVERVLENSKIFNSSFDDELHRVIIHGVLHYMGYKDKIPSEKKEMREKENQFLKSLKYV